MVAPAPAELLGSGPLAKKSPEPLSADPEVMGRGAAGFLLETVKRVDGFLELRDVKDSVFRRCVNPQLVDARPDIGHGLPVFGRETKLYQMEIMASDPARILREGLKVGEGRTDPAERFHGHQQYTRTSMEGKASARPSAIGKSAAGFLIGMWGGRS
jgi:hypothetical protein